MSDSYYKVWVDNNPVADHMPFHYAIILIKGIYTEFYAEPNLRVTIEKVSYETDMVRADEPNDN